MIPKGTVKRLMKENTGMNISAESVEKLVEILQEYIETTTKLAEENARNDKRKTIKARDIESCDEERLRTKIIEIAERTEKVNILTREFLKVLSSELRRK